MIRFNSDYTEGCHPAILRRLEETNMEQTAGYGEDEYCREAAERIKAACLAPDAPPCERQTSCVTLPMWKRFDQVVHNFFYNITLEDLVKESQSLPKSTN